MAAIVPDNAPPSPYHERTEYRDEFNAMARFSPHGGKNGDIPEFPGAWRAGAVAWHAQTKGVEMTRDTGENPLAARSLGATSGGKDGPARDVCAAGPTPDLRPRPSGGGTGDHSDAWVPRQLTP